jgi:hypothetical protein
LSPRIVGTFLANYSIQRRKKLTSTSSCCLISLAHFSPISTSWWSYRKRYRVAASYHWHVSRQHGQEMQQRSLVLSVAASYHWHIPCHLPPHIINPFLINMKPKSMQKVFVSCRLISLACFSSTKDNELEYQALHFAASYHWHVSRQPKTTNWNIKLFILPPHIIGTFLLNRIVFSL